MDFPIRCTDCELLQIGRAVKALSPPDPGSAEEMAKLGLGYIGPGPDIGLK